MLIAAGSAGLAPSPSRSQPRRRPLIGVLHPSDPTIDRGSVDALEPGLLSLGWTPGRDVFIEIRYGYSDPARIAEAAQALVAMQPDVLFTGGNPGAVPLSRLTTTIPIVAPFLHDPIGLGLTASLGRPSANVTGLTTIAGQGVLAKRMQMLMQCLPQARRLAALWAPRDSGPAVRDEMLAAARSLGVTLDVVPVESGDAYPEAFQRLSALRPDGLMISGLATITSNLGRITDFTLQQRLPASAAIREFPQAGLLMSYGHRTDLNRRRAVQMVDKILRGARPSDIPIEQPVAYELVINLRTARAVGAKVPLTLSGQADEVIE